MAGIRWGRVALATVTGLLALFVVAVFAVGIVTTVKLGRLHDWDILSAAAQRWVHGGSYFLDRQLHGPYDWANGDVLYPPAALFLFVPFSFLPAVCWFIVPGGVIVAALRRLRPAMWTWPLMLAVLPLWRPFVEVLSGNPVIWIYAALFASAAWGFPASVVFLKPTLLPFALFRANTRAWWIGLATLAVPSLLLLPLNLQWIGVMLNSQGGGGFLHNIEEVPYALIPFVAWLGRSTRLAEHPLVAHPEHPQVVGARQEARK